MKFICYIIWNTSEYLNISLGKLAPYIFGGMIGCFPHNKKKGFTVLREQLSDLCHRQWSGWMRYLFRFGTFNDDGTFTMDADKVERWQRQMNTEYSDLSLQEQISDRKEADKFLAIIER